MSPARKSIAKSASKPANPKSAKPASTRVKGESPDELKKRALRISNTLRKIYGAKGTALHFKGPYQLLVSTVLSAQCTDDMVNKVTPVLFASFPTPQAAAAASQEQIEKIIHSTGFYRQKAKSILNLSKAILEKFDGKVPETMEDLTSLPGVGRKTANLVRAMVFGYPGLIVDTHFRRLSQRLGLVDSDDATKIEFQIAEILPPDHWTEFSNSMIWHGRALCPARAPKCVECPVLKDCPTGSAEHGAIKS